MTCPRLQWGEVSAQVCLICPRQELQDSDAAGKLILVTVTPRLDC